VAELADALASGASSRKGVEVRVLSWAPKQIKELRRVEFFIHKAVALRAALLGTKFGTLHLPQVRRFLLLSALAGTLHLDEQLLVVDGEVAYANACGVIDGGG
jgi:hypothetical protein